MDNNRNSTAKRRILPKAMRKSDLLEVRYRHLRNANVLELEKCSR
jgi:hypothetical protein